MKVNDVIQAAILGLGVVLLIGIIFAVFAALPVMFLWNWLIPILVPSGILATKITFWQSFGLVFLTAILFKTNATSSK